MLPPRKSLAEIYPEEALRTLLETTREGFHALVYRGGRNGDFEFLERALEIVEPAQLPTGVRIGMYGPQSLTLTTGDGKEVKLSTESLFGSFLRALRGRDFGGQEQAFLEKLLSKVYEGNPKLPNHDINGDALLRVLTLGADEAAKKYLIGLGAKGSEKPAATEVKIGVRELYANALGMAIITGDETVFTLLLSQDLPNGSASNKIMSWEDVPAIQLDSATRAGTGQLNALDTVLLYAEPQKVQDFLRIYHEKAPLSTAVVDKVLETHLSWSWRADDKTIGYAEHWSRGITHPTWSEEPVNAILAYRDKSVPFSDALLIKAMESACFPVLEAALEHKSTNFSEVRKEGNPFRPVNCTKLIASASASADRISRSLEAAITGGIDIDEYSDGTTALIDAAKDNNLDLAGVLLQHGADPLATDSRNWKASSNFKDRAQREQFELMIKALKAQRSIDTVLKSALGRKP